MTTSSPTPDSRFPTPSAWQPSADDHLIYRWVKFEGYTQCQVAQMLRISQPSVSRVVQRYERWQAHMKDREGGRLNARERLRAQRWLAYERNEHILASCQRIAEEMERSTELSKTTIRRPIDQPSRKDEIRTEQRVVDRHGVAARFLRLAWRINMDQLKLCETLVREGEAHAEPLTDEELAEELRQAAADAAELAAARQQVSEENDLDNGCSDDEGSRHGGAHEVGRCDEPDDVGCVESPSEDETHQPDEPPAPSPQPPAPPLNNLNNDCVLEITTTPNAPCTCTLQPTAEKNSCACIIHCEKVGRSGPDRPDVSKESQFQPKETTVTAPIPAVA